MAVSASQIEERVKLLATARKKFYNAIVKHDQAVLSGLIKQIQELGGDLNKPWRKSDGDAYDDTNPPIVLAAAMHNLEAMRLLLNTNKIDLNYESRGCTPVLMDVCRTGNEQAAAMILRKGVPVNIQGKFNQQPIHEAFFAPLMFDYSVVFHSSWGEDPSLKQNLIAWWNGAEFTPSAPLRARWPGAIPLVALLLDQGADPTVKTGSGMSLLRSVQDPTCVLKSPETLTVVELAGRVKFMSNEGDILTFQVLLRERRTTRKLQVLVDVDYNMPLPEDVRINSAISEILTSKKTGRTMRGLIEAFAPKDKRSLAVEHGDIRDLKLRMEAVEVAAVEVKLKAEAAHGSAAAAAAAAVVVVRSVEDVKAKHEEIALRVVEIHGQHVEVYKKHQADEAYRARIEAVTRDKESSAFIFFDKLSKELYRVLESCKLLIADPDQTTDKTKLAATLIDGLAGFVPSPFDKIPKVGAALVGKYAEYQKGKRQQLVIDLLPLDLIPMCRNLALELTEHYKKQLDEIMSKLLADPEIGPDKAKDKIQELAKNAMGTMMAIMCKETRSIDPRDSATEIEYQLRETVKESAFFQQKLLEATQKLSLAARVWDRVKLVDMAAAAPLSPSAGPLASPPVTPAFAAAAAPAAGSSPVPSPLPGRPPGLPPRPQLPPGPRPVLGAASPRPVILSGPPVAALPRPQSPPPGGSQEPGKVATPAPLSPRPGSRVGAVAAAY